MNSGKNKTKKKRRIEGEEEEEEEEEENQPRGISSHLYTKKPSYPPSPSEELSRDGIIPTQLLSRVIEATILTIPQATTCSEQIQILNLCRNESERILECPKQDYER